MPQSNVSLAAHTTLGVGGFAEWFVEVTAQEELVAACAWATERSLSITVIGGGSNVLVADTGIPGLVIKMQLLKREASVTDEYVRWTLGAGETLDAVVAEAVRNGWWGIENWSHIPGSVGAVPIQNVGAYGVEAVDVVESVSVYNTHTCEFETISVGECGFTYRDSIFKHPAGTHYIVVAVTLRLSKTPYPQLAYTDLTRYFDQQAQPALEEIRAAVIAIRSKKFPDWHEVGTAGSFFKNPIISKAHYRELCEQYPGLPGHTVTADLIKVSLGWILDNICKLRGFRDGAVALHEDQALVLTADHSATAAEIDQFAQQITERVFAATSISIEREVTALPK